MPHLRMISYNTTQVVKFQGGIRLRRDIEPRKYSVVCTKDFTLCGSNFEALHFSTALLFYTRHIRLIKTRNDNPSQDHTYLTFKNSSGRSGDFQFTPLSVALHARTCTAYHDILRDTICSIRQTAESYIC